MKAIRPESPHAIGRPANAAEPSGLVSIALERGRAESLLPDKHEEALRDSEERFRNSFDFAAIGMALLAPDGRWLKVNQSLCDIVGYTADELLTVDFQEITHPDDLEADLKLARKLIAGDIPYYHLEKRYIHKQGRVIWSLLSVSLVKDRDGTPLHAVAQIQDITARKETERRLAETSRSREEALALLDTLQDEAPAGLAFVDLDFRFVRCNEAMAEIDGVAAADHLGRTAQDIVPRIWPQIEPHFRHVMAGNGPVLNREISGETAARPGVIRHWLANYYPVKIGSELIGIGVIVHEITERRVFEEQLRQSQKLEAIGRLAGGIAHDFNNLLTVVNGYSRHLLDKVTSDHSTRAGLTAIHEAGQRAASLVRQLLAFSRGQALQPSVLNLQEVIQQSENLLRQLLDYQIHLVIQCEPDLASVRVDRSQMEQVLMNLVVNARDAMPQGGWLTIQAGNLLLSERRLGIGCDLQPGRYVRISVADTGHGMTNDVMAKIFEPFFTTKDVGKGTGLGLPVVHGIVQQSGGQIEVTSEIGVGSCFAILLPALPS